MEAFESRVTDARKRISALVLVARGVWVINSVVGLVSFVCHRYELASIAGYTSFMSLLVAAYARRAVKHLYSIERIFISN